MPRADRQSNSTHKTVVDGPELPLARPVPRVDVPVEMALKPRTLLGAIALCVQLSGLEPKEVYLSLGIDAGHWSRIMAGEAHFPVNKLDGLMDLCGNEVPLIWLAHQRGYALTLLRTEAERRAEVAEAEAEALRQRVQWLEQLITRKAS